MSNSEKLALKIAELHTCIHIIEASRQEIETQQTRIHTLTKEIDQLKATPT